MSLNSPVLVLNRNYQPIRVTTVRRAMVMLYSDIVRALDEEYQIFDFDSWSALSSCRNESINTVNQAIRIPRIVVLQVYDRVPIGRVRFSRNNIFLRDKNQCQYCAKTLPRKELNLDHVKPRTLGGRTNWENIVTSCIPCNIAKGGKNPEQAGMQLIREPKKPAWKELNPMRRFPALYRQWLPFIHTEDASYWNAELECD